MWIFWLQIQFWIFQSLKRTHKVFQKSYKELKNYSGYYDCQYSQNSRNQTKKKNHQNSKHLNIYQKKKKKSVSPATSAAKSLPNICNLLKICTVF